MTPEKWVKTRDTPHQANENIPNYFNYFHSEEKYNPAEKDFIAFGAWQ